jgi:hypothetical protein
MMGSEQVLMPEITSWDTPVDVQPMARPGTTQFV